MTERTGWDRRPAVRAHGKGLVGHAGEALLRRCAARVGLAEALVRALPVGGPGQRNRSALLVQLAVSITLGRRTCWRPSGSSSVTGRRSVRPPSNSTARRTLAALDETTLGQVAKARRRARRHVWSRLHLRPGNFP
ncbi:hypothetical protein [Streptomyces sp. NPDC059371]|uniref:hypothetical protein n=1 Tax=Streptomyces sp. NPDC059371 TaxID=3346812 RepID=UPI0036B86F8F